MKISTTGALVTTGIPYDNLFRPVATGTLAGAEDIVYKMFKDSSGRIYLMGRMKMDQTGNNQRAIQRVTVSGSTLTHDSSFTSPILPFRSTNLYLGMKETGWGFFFSKRAVIFSI